MEEWRGFLPIGRRLGSHGELLHGQKCRVFSIFVNTPGEKRVRVAKVENECVLTMLGFHLGMRE